MKITIKIRSSQFMAFTVASGDGFSYDPSFWFNDTFETCLLKASYERKS